ncbi:hypothetical protein PS627_00094 [Pseudomonas fluorescens]|uniref:hypothetical protein n=1 Tax=Pseudomonas fluorescens TaxID=294 RepID=UPI00125C7C36|nr:hypothetical protein [Pseudomonas fluorescens]CAG8863158.1 hypothetical protein PS627_00094 [Pseudomonas fluorescens]
MKKKLLIIAAMLVSGCNEQSKLESACASIVRDASVDPSAVVINKTAYKQSDMKLYEAYEIISAKYDRKTPKSITEHTDKLINRSEPPRMHVVAIDWTGSTASGRVRSYASCTFIADALPQTFLSEVDFDTEAYKGTRLNALFDRVSIPSELDTSLFVR